MLHRAVEHLLRDVDGASVLHDAEAFKEKIDADGDAHIDAGELEVLLKKTRLTDHFTVKELISRFDASGDGKLSGAEIPKLNDVLLRKRREIDMQLAAQLSPRSRSKVATIFDEHDRDKSGALSTGELGSAVKQMGHEMSDAQLEQLLAEFDFDGSQALDLLEFTAFISRLLGYKELPTAQVKLLRRVFAYMDTDGDGRIDADELRAVVDRFGIKVGAGQLESYLAEFDASGDGALRVNEFCSLMAKLQGRMGITANPAMVAKDLSLTVKKLEALLQQNESRAQAALGVLLREARLGCMHVDATSALSAESGGAKAGSAPTTRRDAAQRRTRSGGSAHKSRPGRSHGREHDGRGQEPSRQAKAAANEALERARGNGAAASSSTAPAASIPAPPDLGELAVAPSAIAKQHTRKRHEASVAPAPAPQDLMASPGDAMAVSSEEALEPPGGDARSGPAEKPAELKGKSTRALVC